ncbi:hypothetical protein [Clostridium sp. AWRP]|uniref:hypothetical protein n=1 Tax=Clostridium sp. AWRP TaxID=2212991 RepID=UPI001FA96218|nr:hypothetical protein [Clostridium sp. AWRP]
MGNYVNILGIDFSKLNLNETVELIDTKISEGSNETFHPITVNPEIAVQIQEDPELKKYQDFKPRYSYSCIRVTTC